MAQQSRARLLTGMLLVAAACMVLILALDLAFVHTTRGALVDDAALRGTAIGRRHVIDPARNILDLVSVTALGLATIALGVVAFLRHRPILALLAMGLVVGSNVTTAVLKHAVFTRPLLDPYDALPFSTLPSGHTTVALSVGVALALVAPAGRRWIFAVVGAAYGAATGVATMSAGWHRPSDAVAGCLVVATWTALTGAAAVLLLPDQIIAAPITYDRTYSLTVRAFVAAATGLLLVGAGALVVTANTLPAPGSRSRLFLAYAGGASAVAGAAIAAMTALLVVARRCRTDDLDRGQSPS